MAALARPTVTPPRVLLVVERQGGDAPPPVEGALTLAALAMSAEERQRLDGALVTLGDRLELRANPLADDLEDEAPDAELRRLLPATLPKLTAAASLLAGAWRAPDGDVTVRAVATCPAGARCVDPWARGGDGEARRARFLAWPVSSAALVELADAESARRAAAHLRAQAAARDSRIALVVGGAPAGAGGLADPRVLADLRAHAARVAHRLRRAGGDPRFAALVDGGLPSPPSWAEVEPRQLLIVPRLGSVAALSAFVAEVSAVAPDAAWLVRPRALD